MIDCENLVKIYKTKEFEVLALQGLDLTVDDGEFMAIIGNSGSGKSTLLNMLGGLDRPTAGKLVVDGKDMLKATTKERVQYKRHTVGFVWQNNARNLIPYLTAIQNVELPLVFASVKADARRQRALELLDQVGLSSRRNARLQELSGGEQQRVAIAIALSNRPRLLLADEPTGSVDTKTAGDIMAVFRRLQSEQNQTIVIVTHDMHLSRQVSRVVAIRDGRTSSEFRSIQNPKVRPASLVGKIKTNETDVYGEPVSEGVGEDFFDVASDQIALEKRKEDESRMNHLSHQELAVIDRFGRLQIPQEYLAEIGIIGKDMVRVELVDGQIVLFPTKEQ
jgi:ABC-type lipoprotein export system ATPase subunit